MIFLANGSSLGLFSVKNVAWSLLHGRIGSQSGGPILPEPVLLCKDLRVTLPDGRPLFQGLCVDIFPAQRIQIVGLSGCGKTTVLRMLTAFERPEAGTILWNRTPLENVPGPVLRSSVIYVAQTPAMVAATVHTNLLLPFGFRNHRSRPDHLPSSLVISWVKWAWKWATS